MNSSSKIITKNILQDKKKNGIRENGMITATDPYSIR